MKELLFPFLVAMTATLPGVTTTGCMHACTEMACSDSVTFQVTGAFDTFINAFPANVHICVGTVCTDAVLDVNASGQATCTATQADCAVDAIGVVKVTLLETGSGGGKATIEIVGAGGTQKYTDEGKATVATFLPNGEGCGGECAQGAIAFTAKVN